MHFHTDSYARISDVKWPPRECPQEHRTNDRRVSTVLGFRRVSSQQSSNPSLCAYYMDPSPRPAATNYCTTNLSTMNAFEMLDDAMLNDDFGSEDFDLRGGSLNLDYMDSLPPDVMVQNILLELDRDERRGLKRNSSWDELARAVSDESDGDITKAERDELQDFLQDVGITEPPVSPSPCTFDTVECWGVTISPVSEEQDVQPDSIGSNPHKYYDPTNGGSWRTISPPEKRRRMMPPPLYPHPVTPLTAFGDYVSMPPLPPHRPPMGIPPPAAPKRKGATTNKNRTTRMFVPFEEMQRLMAQYGPIKTPRKRKGKGDDDIATAKRESIKRKVRIRLRCVVQLPIFIFLTKT